MPSVRETFLSVPQGTCVDVTISNAGENVLFGAALYEDGEELLSWDHNEIRNNIACVQLEGAIRKRLIMQATFIGQDSFDLDIELFNDDEERIASRSGVGFAGVTGDVIRFIITFNMEGGQ